MTRRGKIARLPQPIREQINRRLQNGEEGIQIIQWLNALPEVIAQMISEFDGQPINEPNLSHWKLGGYRDWEAQQEALEAVRRFGADAVQLSQALPSDQLSQAVPGAQLADHLALCLTARLALAMQQPPEGADDPAGELERLRQLRTELVALRKGDHHAQWLRIQSRKLDLHMKKYADKAASSPRLLRTDGGFTKETIDKLAKDLNLF
jgi:hypothetical protein